MTSFPSELTGNSKGLSSNSSETAASVSCPAAALASFLDCAGSNRSTASSIASSTNKHVHREAPPREPKIDVCTTKTRSTENEQSIGNPSRHFDLAQQ